MTARRFVVCVVIMAAALSCFALEVPKLEGRVMDLAGIFSSTAVGAMAAESERLEQENGAQVAVLTIPSLEGQPLEDYSIRVVEAEAGSGGSGQRCVDPHRPR